MGTPAVGRVEFIDTDANQLWTVGWEQPLQTWFASVEPWPPATNADDPQLDVLGTTSLEIGTSDELLHQLTTGYGVEIYLIEIPRGVTTGWRVSAGWVDRLPALSRAAVRCPTGCTP